MVPYGGVRTESKQGDRRSWVALGYLGLEITFYAMEGGISGNVLCLACGLFAYLIVDVWEECV